MQKSLNADEVYLIARPQVKFIQRKVVARLRDVENKILLELTKRSYLIKDESAKKEIEKTIREIKRNADKVTENIDKGITVLNKYIITDTVIPKEKTIKVLDNKLKDAFANVSKQVLDVDKNLLTKEQELLKKSEVPYFDKSGLVKTSQQHDKLLKRLMKIHFNLERDPSKEEAKKRFDDINLKKKTNFTLEDLAKKKNVNLRLAAEELVKESLREREDKDKDLALLREKKKALELARGEISEDQKELNELVGDVDKIRAMEDEIVKNEELLIKVEDELKKDIQKEVFESAHATLEKDQEKKQYKKPEKSPAERISDTNKILSEHFGTTAFENKAILFEDIGNYDSIESLMGENPMLLIIYRSKETYGHWTCLFRNNFGLNYFNSYGTYIDKAIDNIPKEFKELSGQNFPHLLKLLSESPLDVFWNDIKLQDSDSQTCGRWVGYVMQTCAGSDISIEEFGRRFKKFSNKDEIIVEITEPFLKENIVKKVSWIE